MDRAGVALSCGPLIIIACVTSPQTSYKGELQGAVLVTAPSLAAPGDTLTMDNWAIVPWAPRPPHQECADMDLRQQSLSIWKLDRCPSLGSPAIMTYRMPQVQKTAR